jgi:hypothetical protein
VSEPKAAGLGRWWILIGVVIGMMITCVPMGLLLALPDSNGGARAHIAETITIKWSDSIEHDGPPRLGGMAHYGIHVYVTPRRRDADPGPYKVHAVCYIGPAGSYFDDIGVIGRASDWGEANEKFGVVRFTPAGAYIGDGLPAADGSEDDFLYPTNRMITHR